MRVLAIALVALLAQGCLVGDNASEEKTGRPAPKLPWEDEDRLVKRDANTMNDLCGSYIGLWQEYGELDKYYLIPDVNWHGEGEIETIDVHRYSDRTSAREGEPSCRVSIWIDSLAVRYMEKHNVECYGPITSKGSVFFTLNFPNNKKGEVYFERLPNGDCEAKLIFIIGNEDGSLTMVMGKEHSWDLNHPFNRDKEIVGYKGELLSADKHGVLGDISDTVVHSISQRRGR